MSRQKNRKISIEIKSQIHIREKSTEQSVRISTVSVVPAAVAAGALIGSGCVSAALLNYFVVGFFLIPQS